MAESVTIPPKSSRKDALDYQHLYDTAVEAIQKYSGNVWSDYNLHDPGVTIVEVLAYALTDLGYRTKNRVVDILAMPAGTDVELLRDTLFPPEDVLSCSAITLNDYRKIMLEIEGVKNVAILPAFDQPDFKGLYDIEVVAENIPGMDPAQLHDSIRDEVFKLVRENRNLCEDFDDVRFLDSAPLAIELELETDPDVSGEVIASRVAIVVQEYLTPTIRFQSLDELWDLEMPVDQIFSGPTLSSGFIPDHVLENHWIRRDIRTSDLINIIMDIPGVRFVRQLNLVDRFSRTHKWRYELEPGFAPVLDLEASHLKLVSKNNIIESGTNLQSFQDRIRKLRSVKSSHKQLTFPRTRGDFQDLSEYHSIQHEFPAAYGIGEEGIREYGLDSNDLELREAQARQLKGYLMIFEQLLANYFSQLANLNQLFCIEDVRQTFFQQPVLDMPRGQYVYTLFVSGYLERNLDLKNDDLLRREWNDFKDKYQRWLDLKDKISQWDKLSTDEEAWQEAQNEDKNLRFFLARFQSLEGYHEQHQDVRSFHAQLEYTEEDQDTFLKRRSQVLDHLLARFSVDVTSIAYRQQGAHLQEEDVNLRLEVLRNFVVNSADRGDGYNHCENVLDPENRSGLEKWWGSLLGIPVRSKRFVGETLEGLLSIASGQGGNSTEEEFVIQFHQTTRDLAIEQIFQHADERENYRIEDDGSVAITTDKGDVFASLLTGDLPQNELPAIVDSLRDRVQGLNQGLEGMYLIEHLLLRPDNDRKAFNYAVRNSLGEVLFRSREPLSFDGREAELRQLLRVGRLEERYHARRLGVNQYKMVLCSEDGALELESSEFFYSEEEVQARVELFHRYLDEIYTEIVGADPHIAHQFLALHTEEMQDSAGMLRKLYDLVTNTTGDNQGSFRVIQVNQHYLLQLVDDNEEPVFEGRETYRDKAGALAHINFIRDGFERAFTKELQKHSAVEYYTTQYDLYNQVSDPYSMILTVIMPSWPYRFQDSQFRRHIEQTILRETPAHLAVNVKWLNFSKMGQFEEIWYAYLATRAGFLENPMPGMQEQLDVLTENLLELLAE